MSKGFPKEIQIGNKLVGNGHPAYLIAEIGANFDNSLTKAKELCSAAKEAGADCAKFQSFISEKIVSAKGFERMNLKGVHGTWGRPVNEVFKDAEFPREWHHEVMEYCNKIGIDFSSSPYDFAAVDLCVDLKVPFIKIGSGEITWLEMLKYIAKKDLPMILATGDASLSEIDEAIRTIEETGNKKLILLQCITNYPSQIESANINVLKTYQSAFDILTGYSDHSAGDLVILGSIALGGCVVEKHFTLSKLDKGPDHPHSMDVSDFTEMAKRIRLLEIAMGSSRKLVVPEEEETVYVQRRGLYAAKDIAEGQKLQFEDIEELRPALGILPKYKPTIIGKTLNKTLTKGEPIFWENIG
ncbi:MAG: flagellar biosynthesis protein FlgA [Chitinophagaceae bacterium BSSC1]|jgi:sialic acid synthase SpsE|nr:MAG: flagellar biosynthesis protein FlgA [Chitinophagaceae bacterium BSSC1]